MRVPTDLSAAATGRAVRARAVGVEAREIWDAMISRLAVPVHDPYCRLFAIDASSGSTDATSRNEGNPSPASAPPVESFQAWTRAAIQI